MMYLPLSDRDSNEIPRFDALETPRDRLLRHTLLLTLWISLIVNIVSIRFWFFSTSDYCERSRSQSVLYSPAQSVLEYKTVKFHSGFGEDIPVYDRAPSEEVDAAWESLYEFAYNKVPREQAALMPNRSYPILGEEDHYMIALDVFHQLHCLNEMRKAMYPEYYPITPEGIHTPHMQHCISSLRQSLMCSADISTIVWQWSEKSQAAKERSDVVHTCRNFDKITDWARAHFVPHQQNMSVYIEDDLQVVPF